jgi:hypothetical protein
VRWTIGLLATATTAFLVFGVSLVLSGGGLSRGILPEPANTWVATLAWVALAVFPLALVGALVAAVASLIRGSWSSMGSPSTARTHPASRHVRSTVERDALDLLVLLGAAATYLFVFNNDSTSAALLGVVVLLIGAFFAMRLIMRGRAERRGDQRSR